LVQCHAVLEPAGVRIRSGHHEDVANGDRGALPVRCVTPRYTLQAIRAFERDDPGVRLELDPGRFLDPPDQVARHGVGKPGSPDQQVDTPVGRRKKYGGLTGGVRAPDDDDVLAPAEHLLYRGSAVVDADTLEAGEVRNVGLAVSHARCDHDRPRRHAHPGAKADPIGPAVAIERHRRPRNDALRAEFLSLQECAARKVVACDARGESEVVLDARARARLAAWRRRLQDEEVQTLRSPEGRGPQPAGTGADDDDVAHDVPAQAVQAQALGDLFDRRLPQNLLAAANENGYVVHAHAEPLESRLHARIAVGV